MSRAVTFIEIMIVVLIVGIIAAFTAPAYINAQERAKNQQAVAMLNLIREAERMHDLETGSGYVACVGAVDCNAALGIDLPITRAAWSYGVTVVVTPPTFTAVARRNGVDNRIWTINQSINPPVCSNDDNRNYCFD